MARYLLIISLTSLAHASKADGFSADDNAYLNNIIAQVRGCLTQAETIMSGKTSIFAGIAPTTAAEVYGKVRAVLRNADIVHVIEIGGDFATTHAAFKAWLFKTG